MESSVKETSTGELNAKSQFTVQRISQLNCRLQVATYYSMECLWFSYFGLSELSKYKVLSRIGVRRVESTTSLETLRNWSSAQALMRIQYQRLRNEVDQALVQVTIRHESWDCSSRSH
jgi:hypothetical protein